MPQSTNGYYECPKLLWVNNKDCSRTHRWSGNSRLARWALRSISSPETKQKSESIGHFAPLLGFKNSTKTIYESDTEYMASMSRNYAKTLFRWKRFREIANFDLEESPWQSSASSAHFGKILLKKSSNSACFAEKIRLCFSEISLIFAEIVLQNLFLLKFRQYQFRKTKTSFRSCLIYADLFWGIPN